MWQRVYCSGGCVCYLCADFTSLLTYVPQGGLWSVQGVVLERPLRRAAVQQVRETHDAQGAAGREAALPELRLPVSTSMVSSRANTGFDRCRAVFRVVLSPQGLRRRLLGLDAQGAGLTLTAETRGWA